MGFRAKTGAQTSKGGREVRAFRGAHGQSPWISRDMDFAGALERQFAWNPLTFLVFTSSRDVWVAPKLSNSGSPCLCRRWRVKGSGAMEGPSLLLISLLWGTFLSHTRTMWLRPGQSRKGRVYEAGEVKASFSADSSKRNGNCIFLLHKWNHFSTGNLVI